MSIMWVLLIVFYGWFVIIGLILCRLSGRSLKDIFGLIGCLLFFLCCCCGLMMLFGFMIIILFFWWWNFGGWVLRIGLVFFCIFCGCCWMWLVFCWFISSFFKVIVFMIWLVFICCRMLRIFSVVWFVRVLDCWLELGSIRLMGIGFGLVFFWLGLIWKVLFVWLLMLSRMFLCVEWGWVWEIGIWLLGWIDLIIWRDWSNGLRCFFVLLNLIWVFVIRLFIFRLCWSCVWMFLNINGCSVRL